jgi:predicted MPP superfamily phosphohydrolase
LINNALEDLPAGLDAVLKMQARYGVWTCEGNHDLIENRWAFENQTKAAGVNLLIDEQQILDVNGHPLQLLGLRWGRGQAAIDSSMRNVLSLRRPDAFPILLAHHPHAFDNAAAAGIPLTLSGHTHGGQLMLNERLGAGPVMFRYWSGLYSNGDSRLVVSNGVGNWFPLRTHAPAEIIHITLRGA